jgi:hypothetical protein
VIITVANQTAKTQKLTIDGNGIKQSTAPINPEGTAKLTVNLEQGSYSAGVDGGGIKPAKLNVGPERPSSQDKLLLP